VINPAVDWGDDSGDILLIGGDSDAAEMYLMKLVLDGYRVIAVADIGDVAARRDGWRPDLVLIDLGAGVGEQLHDLQRLRVDPALAGVPALLLSTRSEEELRQRGVTLGPMDYVLRTGYPPTRTLPGKGGGRITSPHANPPPQAGEGS